jgi:hypothetical protein
MSDLKSVHFQTETPQRKSAARAPARLTKARRERGTIAQRRRLDSGNRGA